MYDLRFDQNLECVLRDLVTENADLQSRNQDLQSRLHRERTEAQQQLREKVNARKTPFFWCLIPDCRRNNYNPVRGRR